VIAAPLPVEAALPALRAALGEGNAAVLVAPPGAGKTTRVPLALLDEPWVAGGRLIVLEPRRLAARAAATRMAQTLGEKVGERVGFRVRLQSRISARTRIEVVTEGVFARMILDDPSLDGIAAILFDEYHERSLDADLGLALALDAQGALRPDLRLLAMSATLDGARVAALLGDAPVIESRGRAFPVETRYLGREPRRDIADQTAEAVLRALDAESGSILVFLPGAREIRRCERRLGEALRDPAVIVAPLFGALEGEAQDRAIEPAPPGQRKVVLATSIAETSLTIEGVRVVIDCGLARVPRYDPATGLTGLDTVRVSRAAADQRRGRAGRTQPGICWRLWDEAETRALPAFATPEILEADLGPLALSLAEWGTADPASLRWLDPPPAGAWREAVTLLRDLDALDGDGRLTETGRALARLPLPPRLAHMIVAAVGDGCAWLACRIALLLTERGLAGNDADLRHRLATLEGDRGQRARDGLRLAEGWLRLAGGRRDSVSSERAGEILALAYPDRVARARPGAAGEFVMASGRGAFIDVADALSREAWLAIGELADAGTRARILLAAPLVAEQIEAAFAHHIVSAEEMNVDAAGRVQARHVRRLGRIELAARRIDAPDPALVAKALVAEIARRGLGCLPWTRGLEQWRGRIAFLRAAEGEDWPDLSDGALSATTGAWLEPYLAGKRALGEIGADNLHDALHALLPHALHRRLEREAPTHYTAPTGSNLAIDYGAEGGPAISVRVQELFGLAEHPRIAGGRVPLVLNLLSPAHRPIQVTRDLPGFWAGSWSQVKSEMKGRYPRHVWPDDPRIAPPTTRAKPRGT
jgi:ATP-dependent helicase HrpB